MQKRKAYKPNGVSVSACILSSDGQAANCFFDYTGV